MHNVANPNELNSIIKPQSNLPVGSLCLLVPSQANYRYLERLLQNSGQKPPMLTKRLLAGSVALQTFADTSLVGPIVGAPQAGIICESLISSGARKIILLSAAALLMSERSLPKIGDIVFPDSAIGEDGTSRAYGAPPIQEFVSSPLQTKLENTVKAKIESGAAKLSCHRGRVWTTDTPYLETPDKISYYREQGAAIVDMEFAAINFLSQRYGVMLAAAFVVSDLLGSQWTCGFRTKAYRLGTRTLLSAVEIV